MLVQFAPFNERAVRFYDPPNVAGLAEKLAGYPNS
jgi:hypothetical protein